MDIVLKTQDLNEMMGVKKEEVYIDLYQILESLKKIKSNLTKH